jgi:hypothetical protein
VRILERELTGSSPQSQLAVVPALVRSCFQIIGTYKVLASSPLQLALEQEEVNLPYYPSSASVQWNVVVCLRSGNCRQRRDSATEAVSTRLRHSTRGSFWWGGALH